MTQNVGKKSVVSGETIVIERNANKINSTETREFNIGLDKDGKLFAFEKGGNPHSCSTPDRNIVTKLTDFGVVIIPTESNWKRAALAILGDSLIIDNVWTSCKEVLTYTGSKSENQEATYSNLTHISIPIADILRGAPTGLDIAPRYTAIEVFGNVSSYIDIKNCFWVSQEEYKNIKKTAEVVVKLWWNISLERKQENRNEGLRADGSFEIINPRFCYYATPQQCTPPVSQVPSTFVFHPRYSY